MSNSQQLFFFFSSSSSFFLSLIFQCPDTDYNRLPAKEVSTLCICNIYYRLPGSDVEFNLFFEHFHRFDLYYCYLNMHDQLRKKSLNHTKMKSLNFRWQLQNLREHNHAAHYQSFYFIFVKTHYQSYPHKLTHKIRYCDLRTEPRWMMA